MRTKSAAILCFSLWITSANADLTKRIKVGKYEGDILLGGLFPLHGLTANLCNPSKIEYDGLFSLEAFYYSLDQLNTELKSNYGFTLGARTMNTCFSQRIGLRRSLKFVLNKLVEESGDQGLSVVGVVGPMSSDVSLQVANLLGMFNIPQISYAATTPLLSTSAYPYFLRTVPSDLMQADALVHILETYGWKYVVGIYEDSSYGLRGFQEFERKALKSGICFAEKWSIDVDHPSAKNNTVYREKLRALAKHTTKSKAKAVLLYVTQSFAKRVFAAAKEEHLENHFVWIGTDGWGSRFIPEAFGDVVEGAIVSHPENVELPGFRDYFFKLNPINNTRNPWFREAYERLLSCKVEPDNESILCDPNGERGSLQYRVEGAEFGYMHFVRDAVFAFGETIKLVHREKCGTRPGVCEAMKAFLEQSDSEEFLQTLKNITYKGEEYVRCSFSGSFIDVNGKPTKFVNRKDGQAIYSIMNYQKGKRGPCCSNYTWVPIGIYSGMENSSIVKNRSKYREDEYRFPESVCSASCGHDHINRYTSQDKCCWSCQVCPFLTIKHNESHCEKCIKDTTSLAPPFLRPNSNRSQCVEFEATVVGLEDSFLVGTTIFAMIGLGLTCISAILLSYFSNTPIMKAAGRELCAILLLGIALCYVTVFLIVVTPGYHICGIVRFLYSFSYTMCYAAIFVKMNRISRIFNMSQGPQRKTKYTSPLSQIAMCGIIIAFQCVLNTVWLVLRHPKVDYILSEGSFLGEYSPAEQVTIYKFCEAYEDGDMAIALLVPAILLILSAIYGFKARKCPGKFNETRYIIITTYGTGVVWLAFIPVFFATDKIPLRVFSLCASLTLIATVTLSCLFLPKFYVALCRPHKNTREAVMGRKSTNSYPTTNDRSPTSTNPPVSLDQRLSNTCSVKNSRTTAEMPQKRLKRGSESIHVYSKDSEQVVEKIVEGIVVSDEDEEEAEQENLLQQEQNPELEEDEAT